MAKFKSVAMLLADTRPVLQGPITVGKNEIHSAEPHSTAPHLTTDGGVRLYVDVKQDE